MKIRNPCRFIPQKTIVHFSHLGKLKSSSNKKRPNNLFFGRIFEKQILDLIETNILEFEGDVDNTFKQFDLGTLPVFLCFGDVFETNPDMARIRNYFSDLFSPFRNEKIYLNVDFGLQLIITLNGFEDKTLIFNFYRYDKSTNSMVDLKVKLSLKVDRVKLAEEDHFKEACKQPRLNTKKKERRNRELNTLGETEGRVFVRQQDLKTLTLRKLKSRTGKKIEKKSDKKSEPRPEKKTKREFKQEVKQE